MSYFTIFDVALSAIHKCWSAAAYNTCGVDGPPVLNYTPVRVLIAASSARRPEGLRLPIQVVARLLMVACPLMVARLLVVARLPRVARRLP